MNPFETPPTSPMVSSDPPSGPPRRRGRMALVALATAGLLAGGIVGVSALANADDPELGSDAVAATDEPELAQPGVTDDESPDEGSDESTGDETSDEAVPAFDIEGLFELDEDQIAQLQECIGLPAWPLGEWMAEGDGTFELDPEFGAELEGLFDEFVLMFDDFTFEGSESGEFVLPGLDGAFGDGQVTVAGPDGVTVIDLGEGDASVTISRDGDSGELTITTDGTATEQPLDELIDTIFGEISPEGLDELFAELPNLDELFAEFGEFGEFEEIDPEQLDEFDGFFDGLFGDGMFLEELDLDAIADCLADLG